ncbi:MAG: glycosyltransferase [Acidobacteriota bacterium]
MQPNPTSEKLAILIPLFDDWAACSQLIGKLDVELADYPSQIEVFLVDDGSPSGGFPVVPDLAHIASIHCIRLRRNLGHQRAICIGLAYLEAQAEPSAILILDADGEDQPSDARRLLSESDQHPGKVVFARRTRRTEGSLFKLGYGCYRMLHRALTGHDIHFGNFSVVPRVQLRALTASPELWNHYAACVLASRIPYTAIDTTRGPRYCGTSHMNVQALLIHGLSAIAVFSPTAGARVVSFFLALGGISAAVVLVVVAAALSNAFVVPVWAIVTGAVFFLVLVQSVLSIMTFLFLVLGARSQATFLPSRDYLHFIDEIRPVK